MMDFAHFSRFDDDADGRTKARLRERLVDGGDGEERRNPIYGRCVVPVAQDDDLCAAFCGFDSIVGQLLKCRLEPPIPRSPFPIPHIQRYRREVGDVSEARDFVVRQHGTRHLYESCVFGCLGKDVALVADVGHDRHHQFLADGVDRRVRHLGEELMEEIEELQPRSLLPQTRQCRIVAHRTDVFVSRLGHRP